MNEKIGNVILNYKFYKGTDEYSDGDVEDLLLQIVKEEEFFEPVLYNTEDFAIYYHLAKEREFITEPMEISKEDNVLEIGAGCGAITGSLAQKAKSVTDIELSKRRSMINAYKNKAYGNIEIIVGNYEDVQLNKQYDVITLIGVFEYSNYYINSDRPFHSMLMDVYGKLAKGGRLYIAIENRLGAKYFAGCKEDHANKEFEGIENYPTFCKAKTFSYYEWINLLEECGINNYEFFYPYPDYKFPRQIYTDTFLPEKDGMYELASNYTSARLQVFDEIRFMKSLTPEEFKVFSNSFLICIRK